MITRTRRYFANISDRDVMLVLMGFFAGAVAVSLGAHLLTSEANWWGWADSFAQNFGAEMFGACLTFLLIEVLVSSRREREATAREIEKLKEHLIHRMGSAANSVALQASEDLRVHEWLLDGSLRGASLAAANLRGARLFEADLSEAHLERANLQGARLADAKLQRAFLTNANLQEAGLSQANLEGAYLRRVDLRGARLRGAILAQAHLEGANLSEAFLGSANLEGADLSSANLQEAQLGNATLRGATLRLANVQGANFRQANLAGASLEKADAQGARFFEADLSGAILRRADLRAANFRQAILVGAVLTGANLVGAEDLTEEQLLGVGVLWRAILPDGSRYDGRFSLPGDADLARKQGVNPDDTDAMRQWYMGETA